MNKSAEYIEFEEGFIKQAESEGCDGAFLRGYIKQADEIVEIWKNAFDELAAESGDPLYKVKLANEIIYFNNIYPTLVKQAAETPTNTSGWWDENISKPFNEKILPPYQNFAHGMTMGMNQPGMTTYLEKNQNPNGSGIVAALASLLKKNPDLLGHLVSMGGAGGMIGLLIGALIGHPMAGLMLGGLGGAGIGAYFGMRGADNPGEPKPEPGEKKTPGEVNPPANSGATSIPPKPIQPPITSPPDSGLAASVKPPITPVAAPVTPVVPPQPKLT